MRRTVLVLALLAAPPAHAQPKQPKLPAGVEAHRDLGYGPHKERHTLDVFTPKSDTPTPLVIWVHGGGWQQGSKNGGNPAMALLEKGYAVAAINYRLSQHAVFPAQIEDCKAAVRFLRANAKKFNLNPDAFGAWGSSAGGRKWNTFTDGSSSVIRIGELRIGRARTTSAGRGGWATSPAESQPPHPPSNAGC